MSTNQKTHAASVGIKMRHCMNIERQRQTDRQLGSVDWDFAVNVLSASVDSARVDDAFSQARRKNQLLTTRQLTCSKGTILRLLCLHFPFF